jgi:uncharacterized 2Fe-2S/4Fe-4S cluster protein (DUF4445 family)
MKTVTVQFLPAGKKVTAAPGDILVDVAMDAGVHINAACGGEGVCGKCRVVITSGEVSSPESGILSAEETGTGWRLACQSRLVGDVEVAVPEEKPLEKAAVQGPRVRVPDGRQAVAQEIEKLAGGARYNPALKKFFVELDPPTLSDNVSDLSRLVRALKKRHDLEQVTIDLLLLQRLSRALRDAGWKVTVTVVQTGMESQPVEHQLRGSRRPTLISVEPGDTTREHYSIVMDIGTTSLWAQLIDLNGRNVLAEASAYNPQIEFGDDVISRIVYSQKPGALSALQQVVVEALNGIIRELVEKAGIERGRISHITAAGNTVMTHLLVGLDPKYIREAPYVPVANFIPPVRAIRVGLAVPDHVYLYTFPSVASYVGGDIVSGVLSSGLYQRRELTLYIDIGTNGEIVVGNDDWLMTASCSAGPAFEGGGLTCGMRATAGAIEKFHINPETLEPMIMTIGRVKPQGICGSGAINILAEFLETGVIAQNGKMNGSCRTRRIREGADGLEYVLAYREETGAEKDVVITEADIENLIRAKAAMFAGYQCLLGKVDLTFKDLDRVIIAGAFGDYIDLEKAITIGLLPELPHDRYIFIGNGSLRGARLISLSSELLDDGERIARKMTNVELSEDRSFMDTYVAGMFLPHTDGRLFPGVSARLSAGKKIC